MKRFFTLLFIALQINAYSQQDSLYYKTQAAINKEIARNFYEDLWFTNHTEKYKDYVADEYIAHDIGDRKNAIEQAIVQKEIADFFWKNTSMSGKIEYQIAEGDLVATKWIGYGEPKTLKGKIFVGNKPIHIINVFRIKDGKIVELWNHRHDIDTPQTLRFVFKGLFIGLLIALIPTIIAFRLKRKLRRFLKE